MNPSSYTSPRPWILDPSTNFNDLLATGRPIDVAEPKFHETALEPGCAWTTPQTELCMRSIDAYRVLECRGSRAFLSQEGLDFE